jgi:hypothetical protein
MFGYGLLTGNFLDGVILLEFEIDQCLIVIVNMNGKAIIVAEMINHAGPPLYIMWLLHVKSDKL